MMRIQRRPKQVKPKPMKTKIIQKILVSLTAGFGAFLAITTADAQTLWALEGNLHHSRLVSITCNGGVCDIVFEGSGTVNIMGPVTVTTHVVQDFSVPPCNTGCCKAGFSWGPPGLSQLPTVVGWSAQAPHTLASPQHDHPVEHHRRDWGV